MLIEIGIGAQFEPLLALAESEDPAFWLSIAALAGDCPAVARPDDLPAALAALPPEAFPPTGADQTQPSAIARLTSFLKGFSPRWAAQQDAYLAATERLRTRMAATGGNAELGSLLDFPILLDPRRRGLRAAAGGPRLSVNRIAAIHILPSAFNRRHFWHLGAPLGGRHIIYLPSHDPVLADRMATVPGARQRHTTATDDAPRLLRALGDNSRLAMAALLARETLSAAEIGRRLSLSPPAVSHHLMEMRAAGLIDETRQGASRQLTLRRAAFAALGTRVLDYLDANPAPNAAMRSRRKMS